MWTDPARAASPDIGVNVGLLVASATAPGTFASSLAPRSALDQGLVTALSTGLHYLLTLGAQDTLQALAELAAGPRRPGRAAGPAADADAARRPRRRPARPRPAAGAADAAGRADAARAAAADRLAVRGDRHSAARCSPAPGPAPPAPDARLGARRPDRRVPAGRPGRPRAGVRAGAAPGPGPGRAGRADRPGRARRRRSGRSAWPPVTTGALVGAAYAEHELATWLGRRLAAVLPGGPLLWRLAGHAACLGGSGGRVVLGLGTGHAPDRGRHLARVAGLRGPARTCTGPAAR